MLYRRVKLLTTIHDPLPDSTMSLVHYKNHSRELAAQLARDISGIFISGGLASIKPWLILATIYNSINCGRHIFAFHKFRKALKLEGIRIRFRDILKGCFEGTLVKLVTTVLTFGHDDFVDVIRKLGRPMGLSRSHAVKAIELDEHRDSKAVIHAMSQAAGTPASGTLDRMHIDKKQQDLGYSASGQVVAKEVFGAGGAQLGGEIAGQLLLEKPYDAARNRMSRHSPNSVWH